MKKKRWRVKTHYCAQFREDPSPYGLYRNQFLVKSCVKCGRIQNWRDVYPVGI